MNSTDEKPTTESRAETGYPESNTFFSNENERRDVAVSLALSGESVDEALKPLNQSYQERLKSLDVSASFRVGSLEKTVADGHEELRKKSEDIAARKAKIEQLRGEDKDLNAKHRESELNHATSWQRIRQARFEHGKQFFKEHQSHLEEELHKNRKEVLAETEHRLAISRKHHEVEKENREANEAEFTRRVEVCNQEKGAVETQLNRALEHAEKLKAIGITRTTATFLFVVGFISLAGSGGAVSSLISDRQPGEPIFSLLLRHLISFGAASIPGPWRAVVLLLLVPLVIGIVLVSLLALYVFLTLVDRLVKKFDPTWNTSRRKQREGRRSPLQDQFTNLTSQLTGLPSQFGALRSVDVDRSHYTKLLASFPYILIGGVIFFLFSGVAFDDSDGNIAINLTTTFIGVTIVLVATAFWVVYITKVIEPRWEKSAAKGSAPSGVAAQFWLNRELSILLLLLVLALGLAAFLPTSGRGAYFTTSQYKHIVWGFVALFMAFGSLGLAYGVIQRGIFKDVDFLARKRDSYRYWIERYSARPTIEDASTYFDDLAGHPISNYMEGRADLYRNQISYELNEVFGDDFEDQQPPPAVQNLWRRLGFVGNANPPYLNLRLKKTLSTEPRLVDFSIAPEATRTFLSSKAEMSRIEQRKTDIGQEIRRLEDEVSIMQNEITRLRTLVEQSNNYLVAAKESIDRERNTLIRDCEKEIMKFRAEFAIGSLSKDLTKEEPEPVPPGGGPKTPVPGNGGSGSTIPSEMPERSFA